MHKLLLWQSTKQIAGIGIPSDKPQCLFLPTPTDEDWWVGLGDSRGRIQWLLQLVVATVKRPGIVAPHLACDLECLLETLEALAEGWEWYAEADVFPLKPGRANTEVRPPTGQDIKRCHLLHQHAWRPVRDAGDQGSKAYCPGDPSEKAQRGVAL